MNNLSKCVLTGNRIRNGQIQSVTSLCIEYYSEIVGKVKITHQALLQINQLDFPKNIVSGICRNRTEQNLEPIILDMQFLMGGYKELNPPMNFEDRCEHFLKLLFDKGGINNEGLHINSSTDYPLSYSSKDEFAKIIKTLYSEKFIDYERQQVISSGGTTLYSHLSLTPKGRSLFKKSIFTPLENKSASNIITIQNMSNSAIQQGAINSKQEVSITQNSKNELGDFIALLNESINKLQLGITEQQEILAEITTLKAQYESPKPKNIIIREGINSVRTIIENVATNTITSVLLERADALIQMFS